MKSYLKNIVEPGAQHARRRVGYGPAHAFVFLIHLLIAVSIVTFSIETTPGLSPQIRAVLEFTEIFCIAVFSLEYAMRIYVADHKLRFIFSFWGIIDLLAILPFYLSLGVDLRSVRALRFFRLFRLFKLARYHQAITHLTAALTIAKEKLLLFLLLVLILIYFSAVGIYYFEYTAQPQHFSSVFDSLWWAVITLTTVGYGDIYPLTVGGRIFTFFILIIGIGIIAIPTGIISAALTEALDSKPRAR